jgi:hypothetical protein
MYKARVAMKKIERKSRVLKLHREIVLHLTAEDLRRAAGGTGQTQCSGCGHSTRLDTEDNQDNQKH